MVQAIFLLGIIVAPTLGPTLGGWITDNYTWNWCFFINIPIGIVVDVPGHDVPARSAGQSGAPEPVDWFGIGLLIVGVGSLQYVLEEGNQQRLVRRRADRRAGDRLGGLARRRWSGGSCRRGTSIRSIDFRVLKNRDLVGVDLPVHRARLRAVRRHVSLPAVHAGHPRLHAHGDRARDAAGRPRDGGHGAWSAAGC